jgi:DNA-directed RNA polymerase alpha subunit
MLMKIHVEFNSIAEMVGFSKFAGSDLVQVPQSKNQQQSEVAYKNAYERTNANLERAYERLRELYDNPKIKAIIDQTEISKNAKAWDEREEVKKEAIENDERFEFSNRALNIFKCENIKTLKDLLNCTENDLFRLPNMGKLTLVGIKEELAKAKLKLKQPPKAKK